MFFKINAECHIGFKKLTAADLGIGTSHQTHIGLYEGVLNFLPDVDVVSTAMLICDGYCDIIKCYFDRIEIQMEHSVVLRLELVGLKSQ